MGLLGNFGTSLTLLLAHLSLFRAHREHKVHNIVLYPDKESWCKTTPIKQVVTWPSCSSQELDNNVCVGACFSYMVPHSEPSAPGDLIRPYCDSCQPLDSIWHTVTLDCKDKDDNPTTMQKKVQIITNCSCSSCMESSRIKPDLNSLLQSLELESARMAHHQQLLHHNHHQQPTLPPTPLPLLTLESVDSPLPSSSSSSPPPPQQQEEQQQQQSQQQEQQPQQQHQQQQNQSQDVSSSETAAAAPDFIGASIGSGASVAPASEAPVATAPPTQQTPPTSNSSDDSNSSYNITNTNSSSSNQSSESVAPVPGAEAPRHETPDLLLNPNLSGFAGKPGAGAKAHERFFQLFKHLQLNDPGLGDEKLEKLAKLASLEKLEKLEKLANEYAGAKELLAKLSDLLHKFSSQDDQSSNNDNAEDGEEENNPSEEEQVLQLLPSSSLGSSSSSTQAPLQPPAIPELKKDEDDEEVPSLQDQQLRVAASLLHRTGPHHSLVLDSGVKEKIDVESHYLHPALAGQEISYHDNGLHDKANKKDF